VQRPEKRGRGQCTQSTRCGDIYLAPCHVVYYDGGDCRYSRSRARMLALNIVNDDGTISAAFWSVITGPWYGG
jgi:hypothetical protein